MPDKCLVANIFRIFCHSNNTYWRLENLEEDKVEEPKVPGGMTGGVEYEAMGEFRPSRFFWESTSEADSWRS